MVEMVVHTMVKDSAKQMVVVLKEREGKRALPIVIGPCEATAILYELRGWVPERPLTHDLMRSILEELEVQVARVVVHDLRNEIYYALLVLVNNGNEQEIDARPSDAIALALRVGAPIYVSDQVVEQAAVPLQDSEQVENEEDERFREIVGQLDIDDIS
jgi:hypothetical protein